LVNPENIFEISRALYRSLTDTELRARMKDAGILQSQRFSWETSVRNMISVYKEVASQRGRSKRVP